LLVGLSGQTVAEFSGALKVSQFFL
jgi:hypothetical protein